MELKQLRAFLAVAETGNMTRAADVLHLVQPAISRHIQLLEADVGAPLFERERYGMVLTEAGRTMAEYARRAMLELDRARAVIGEAATAGVSGLVTLGLLPSTVDTLCSRLISAMSAQYPGIRIRIAIGYAGNLLQWLQSGDVDAALLYGVDRATNIQTRPLIEEPLWAVAPVDARLRRSRPVPLARLARQRVVLPSAPHGIRTLVEHACAVAQVELDIVAETNALSVQRALVLGGHGWTVLPAIAVADDLRARRLSGAPLAQPDLSRTIFLGLPTHRPTGQHVHRAVELLTDTAREAITSGAWPDGRWQGA